MFGLELYHHGIKGQQWGVRRFQNEDGSLTPDGEKRYSESLTKMYGDGDNYDDYKVSGGTSVYRRTQSNKDDDNSDNKKYTYTYDYDNDVDNNFYQQFGKKVTEYSMNDSVFAGRKTLGEAFVNRMMELEDENDIKAMRIMYSGAKNRLGENYVKDLFTLPYEPGKHVDALKAAGADMISRMLSAQRSDEIDEEMKYDGYRHSPTAANDIGRSIVDRLVSDGYSGMRDYNDYGSAAGVSTPTIIFNPSETMTKGKSWIEEEFY